MEDMRVRLVRVLVLLGLTMITGMEMAMEAATGMATATATAMATAAHGRLGDLLAGGDRL
jgi:Na+-translocating ferredoxin:NAD+ oxidoreductase RnfA subunit